MVEAGVLLLLRAAIVVEAGVRRHLTGAEAAVLVGEPQVAREERDRDHEEHHNGAFAEATQDPKRGWRGGTGGVRTDT